jgi:hypothetical protein
MRRRISRCTCGITIFQGSTFHQPPRRWTVAFGGITIAWATMAKSKRTLDFVACPHCRAKVRVDRLNRHVAKAHARNGAPIKLPTNPPPAATSLKKLRKKIYLESRRGIRINNDTSCDDCWRRAATVWEYADSNVGRVRLCASCKAKAFNRSFHRVDALDTTEHARSRQTCD